MAQRKPKPTVTVNAAFLQEIKEVNEELWKLLDEVRDMCQSSLELVASRNKVADQLAELRDQLAMHFALEEAYGYFEDPVVVAPQLDARAGPLRDEHSGLYERVSELVEYVETEQYGGRLASAAPQIVERFREFDRQLQHHESQENELILRAYSDDIGVGD